MRFTNYIFIMSFEFNTALWRNIFNLSVWCLNDLLTCLNHISLQNCEIFKFTKNWQIYIFVELDLFWPTQWIESLGIIVLIHLTWSSICFNLNHKAKQVCHSWSKPMLIWPLKSMEKGFFWSFDCQEVNVYRSQVAILFFFRLLVINKQ